MPLAMVRVHESATETECGLYACGATECLSSCTDDDDCAQGAVCVSGSCVIEDADAGVDGGDDDDAGSDAGSDAGANPSDDAGNEDEGGALASEDTSSDGGCSCRAVGGNGASNHAAWMGLGLAALAMTRRRRGGNFTS